MEIVSGKEKIWCRVRDEASESSAIIQVGYAEQWTKKLEQLLAKGVMLSAKAVYDCCPSECDSGYVASYVYEIILTYWKHQDSLPRKSFGALMCASTNRKSPPPAPKIKARFVRPHSAQSAH